MRSKRVRNWTRAVAEAIGCHVNLPVAHHSGVGFPACTCAGTPYGLAEHGGVIKPYSTELNAAFAAAEKVGLFEDGQPLPIRQTTEQRLRPDHFIIMGRKGSHESYSTPALAICAAILKLKETG